jgi:hypothetical protein
MVDKLQPLLYFVKERERIRQRKAEWVPSQAAMGAPFTKDPILATYRFCNVRRRDDRVSRWLIQNVLAQNNVDILLLPAFLEFSAWCRWCNWPPTIKAVMDAELYPVEKIDWRRVGKLVDTLGKKQKVWTGAYMIRASSEPGAKKGKFISEQVIGKHFRRKVPELIDLLRAGATYQIVWEALREIPNFGSFMAGQVAGDWTYTPLLAGAPDLKTWAPMGPGSIRGFNRIIGSEKLTKRPSEELWQEKLVLWRQRIIDKLGAQYENLTALDVQNILCETDKFLRVKNGEGRPRAKYTPHTY